jgi:hypothetical protein
VTGATATPSERFVLSGLPSLKCTVSGLGLLEYMYLCKDMEMEPIMAVWAGLSHLSRTEIVAEIVSAGYSLGGGSLSEDELAPYIQIAIDQINFVIGDPATNEHGVSDSSFKFYTSSTSNSHPKLPFAPPSVTLIPSISPMLRSVMKISLHQNRESSSSAYRPTVLTHS